MKKGNIRREVLDRLNCQKRGDRIKKSASIRRKLFSLPEFRRAKWVMFYISKDGEVDTIPMIKDAQCRGKRVVVPFILVKDRELIASEIKNFDKELTKGPYGIYQPKVSHIRPVPPEVIDLVVVPGVAFDRDGNRLGRGAGYYDKFLRKIPKRTPLIGLAFDFQVLESLPTLSHDIPVTKVVSA